MVGREDEMQINLPRAVTVVYGKHGIMIEFRVTEQPKRLCRKKMFKILLEEGLPFVYRGKTSGVEGVAGNVV